MLNKQDALAAIDPAVIITFYEYKPAEHPLIGDILYYLQYFGFTDHIDILTETVHRESQIDKGALADVLLDIIMRAVDAVLMEFSFFPTETTSIINKKQFLEALFILDNLDPEQLPSLENDISSMEGESPYEIMIYIITTYTPITEDVVLDVVDNVAPIFIHRLLGTIEKKIKDTDDVEQDVDKIREVARNLATKYPDCLAIRLVSGGYNFLDNLDNVFSFIDKTQSERKIAEDFGSVYLFLHDMDLLTFITKYVEPRFDDELMLANINRELSEFVAREQI